MKLIQISEHQYINALNTKTWTIQNEQKGFYWRFQLVGDETVESIRFKKEDEAILWMESVLDFLNNGFQNVHRSIRKYL